jgi:hypothetical protein
MQNGRNERPPVGVYLLPDKANHRRTAPMPIEKQENSTFADILIAKSKFQIPIYKRIFVGIPIYGRSKSICKYPFQFKLRIMREIFHLEPVKGPKMRLTPHFCAIIEKVQ